MALKELPNRRLYWSKKEPFFYCNIISQILKRDSCERITRCLHLGILEENVKDQRSATHDKLQKVRWMVDEVCLRFKVQWSLNQQMTVDEGRIMYKGKYCPICQYMPKKPVCFGIKFEWQQMHCQNMCGISKYIAARKYIQMMSTWKEVMLMRRTYL